ncbi:MAG TPA: EamA family transporter, partial [bacterium]|nr:EamA family transporter [bacterium]
FAVGFASICLFPVFLSFHEELILIPREVWAMVALTGFFMALYYFSLAAAYRKGDISLAYPIARSSPILVVTFVSFVLGKAGDIGHLALAGILMVVAGCFLLPVKHFRDFSFKNYLSLCCALAFLAAAGTAGYTIIDDSALSLMRNLPGKPFNSFAAAFVYLFMEGASCFLWLGAGILLIGAERRKLTGMCRGNRRDIIIAMSAGVGIFGTYGLVLVSMAFVKNVSYVAAFRQLSIPIGAFLGMAVLKEPRYIPRITGIGVIMAGLILVALG